MERRTLLYIIQLTVIISLLQVEGCQAYGETFLKYRAKYKNLDEWVTWKRTHQKKYESGYHELERHLVWLSNKIYIEQHNANKDIFGFTLTMNYWGDLVS